MARRAGGGKERRACGERRADKHHQGLVDGSASGKVAGGAESVRRADRLRGNRADGSASGQAAGQAAGVRRVEAAACGSWMVTANRVEDEEEETFL